MFLKCSRLDPGIAKRSRSVPDKDLKTLAPEQLRDLFHSAALDQYRATLSHDPEARRFNRCFDVMYRIKRELMSRHPDQRGALVPLLSNPNIAARFNAAISTYTFDEARAVACLEQIAANHPREFSFNAAQTLDYHRWGELDPDHDRRDPCSRKKVPPGRDPVTLGRMKDVELRDLFAATSLRTAGS